MFPLACIRQTIQDDKTYFNLGRLLLLDLAAQKEVQIERLPATIAVPHL